MNTFFSYMNTLFSCYQAIAIYFLTVHIVTMLLTPYMDNACQQKFGKDYVYIFKIELCINSNGELIRISK